MSPVPALTRVAVAAASVLGVVPGVAHAIEQPAFTVVAAYPDWELRRYEPFIEARVTVTGPWDDAVSQGFRVLAGYIFGGNQPRESIAMTAPVTAQRSGQEIAMTAPVAASRATAGTGVEQWTIAFSMPSAWTMDTLPVPNDGRISLVEVPVQDVAVTRFGGWMTERRAAERTASLLATLSEAGFEPAGEPVVAQYNPPWTPPPLRVNEIQVAVRSAEVARSR